MENQPDPTDVPTGLPDEAALEPPPLGAPERDDAPESGPDAMPGIITDREPPASD